MGSSSWGLTTYQAKELIALVTNTEDPRSPRSQRDAWVSKQVSGQELANRCFPQPVVLQYFSNTSEESTMLTRT